MHAALIASDQYHDENLYRIHYKARGSEITFSLVARHVTEKEN